MRLVLFDFDGTITTKDSMIEFLRFSQNSIDFYTGFLCLSPLLLLYKLGLIRNWRMKEMVLKTFFEDVKLEMVDYQGQLFCQEVLPGLLRPEAINKLKEHKENGDRIVVVTASSNLWVQKWVKDQQLELIATQLEVKEGKLTGYLDGKNCYGPEKVRRLSELLKPDKFEEIIVYGDSRGDREMLKLASEGQAYFKPFR